MKNLHKIVTTIPATARAGAAHFSGAQYIWFTDIKEMHIINYLGEVCLRSFRHIENEFRFKNNIYKEHPVLMPGNLRIEHDYNQYIKEHGSYTI